MIIGSVLLGIVIILAVLGLLGKVFEGFRLPSLAAIILLLACPLLMLIPNIYIGSRFAFNIGGFLIPLIGIVGLVMLLGASRNLARAAFATLAVAAVVVLSYMFIPFNPIGMRITAIIITALVAGGVAYLVSGTSVGSFMSVLLGVMLADVALFTVNAIRGTAPSLILGSRISFDIWVIAAVVAVGLYELMRMQRTRTVSTPATKQSLKYEFGEDYNFHTSVHEDEDRFYD